jgi:site-specific DNA-methyltransferase (adenine-specific)
LTASQPFTSALVMSNPDDFKYSWIWDKGLSGNIMLAAFQPMKIHEDVLVFGSGKTTYKPLMMQGEMRQMRNNGMNDSAFGSTEAYMGEFTDKRNPKTILYFPNTDRKNIVHPTQKPVALFEYLIKTYTNEGDLVLDNCAGSGTTGVAAKHLGRNFILIEKEPQYIEIIKKRLSQQQLF